MDIILRTKTIDQVIGYYLEVEHVWRQVMQLVDDTDEIAEQYDFSEWLMDGAVGSMKGIMDVHEILEAADEKASQVARDAEEKLRMIIEASLELKTGLLGDAEAQVTKEDIGTIMEYLMEDFESIYSYDSAEEQVENFKRVLVECARDVINRKNGRKDNEQSDSNDLPFN